MQSLLLPVTSIRRATPTTRIMRLALGDSRFPYHAGQAALVTLAGDVEPAPYSIASAPEETDRHRWLEFLLKEDGRGSHVSAVRRGTLVTVSGPMGSFVLPPRFEERHLLFVAGGTGIAPMRSMIWHALAAGLPARLHLLYSARTPAEFAYLPDLRRYQRDGLLDLVVTATREMRARWRGEHGRITSERLSRLIQTPETLCFVCGPAAMVDAVPQMLLGLGIQRTRIRLEEW